MHVLYQFTRRIIANYYLYRQKYDIISYVLNKEISFIPFLFQPYETHFSIGYRGTRVREMWTDGDARQVETNAHMAVLVRLFPFTDLFPEKNKIFVYTEILIIFCILLSWVFVVNLTWPTTYVIIIKLYIPTIQLLSCIH